MKINYLFAIDELGCTKAYDEYKKTLDPNISENRKARAFCSHYSHILPYRLPCFIKGQEQPYLDFIGAN